MTQQQSMKEIVIPRLIEALERYEKRQGEFLIDNAITACNNLLDHYKKFNNLRPSQRSFALDLIKNSFRINIGENK